MNRGARQKWDVLGPADILNLRLPLVHVFFKNSVDILYSLIGRAPSQNSNECSSLCLETSHTTRPNSSVKRKKAMTAIL